MFGMNQEGLIALAWVIGIFVAAGLGWWVLKRFTKTADSIIDIAKPVGMAIDGILALVIADPIKEAQARGWVQALINGMIKVENRKDEIDAIAEAQGLTPDQIGKLYRETAIKYAEELVEDLGITKPDFLTMGIIESLLEGLYSMMDKWFPAEMVEVVEVDLNKFKGDK